jgi:hypothetical protein
MRLLKLAAYALFGYALYEFVRGLMNEAQMATGGGAGSLGDRGPRKQQMSGARAAQNITGPGEGQEVRTEEPDGGMMRHRVGRGVVR